MGFAFKKIRPRHRMKPGEMNKTEQAYDQRLELLQRAGKIRSRRFAAIKLKLADKTFYTPDFYVVTEEQIEFHEIKGHFLEEDANIKIKVAAEMYPEFFFKMIRLKLRKGILETIEVREY